MNENKIEAPDITVIKLISTLLNKLCPDRLGSKELTTTLLEADEQINAINSISFTKSLT